MQVDEVTKAFHEANQHRRDHLCKAIGGFGGNLTDGDLVEKARSKVGRYANTAKNRKLGRVGMPYEKKSSFPEPHQRRNSEHRRNGTYIRTLSAGDGAEAVEIQADGVARNDFYDNEKVGEDAKKYYEKVSNGDKVRYAGRVRTVYTTKQLTENGITTQFVQFLGRLSYSGAPRGTGKWVPRKDVEKL